MLQKIRLNGEVGRRGGRAAGVNRGDERGCGVGAGSLGKKLILGHTNVRGQWDGGEGHVDEAGEPWGAVLREGAAEVATPSAARHAGRGGRGKGWSKWPRGGGRSSNSPGLRRSCTSQGARRRWQGWCRRPLNPLPWTASVSVPLQPAPSHPAYPLGPRTAGPPTAGEELWGDGLVAEAGPSLRSTKTAEARTCMPAGWSGYAGPSPRRKEFLLCKR